MKNLMLRFTGIFVTLLLLLATGCEDDSTSGPQPQDLPPVLSLESGSGAVTSDITVDPSTIFSVTLNIGEGDNDLQAVTVLEDGVNMPTSRIVSIDGSTITNNPFVITSAGLIDLQIQAHDVEDTRTYTFEVRDVKGNTDAASFDVTVMRSTTPLTGEYSAVVVNNADGPNFGGLDLDNGAAVSSSSDQAELRDLGIDTDLPVDNNWIQKVEPRNGATLRMPDLSQLDNFSFANTTDRETILTAWDTGNDLSESSKLAVDDVLIVKRDDTYWLLSVKNIVETDDNNLDYYEFDIKSSVQ